MTGLDGSVTVDASVVVEIMETDRVSGGASTRAVTSGGVRGSGRGDRGGVWHGEEVGVPGSGGRRRGKAVVWLAGVYASASIVEMLKLFRTRRAGR